jgi:hypothetical protein
VLNARSCGHPGIRETWKTSQRNRPSPPTIFLISLHFLKRWRLGPWIRIWIRIRAGSLAGGNGWIDVEESVTGLMGVLESDEDITGRFLSYKGEEIPW